MPPRSLLSSKSRTKRKSNQVHNRSLTVRLRRAIAALLCVALIIQPLPAPAAYAQAGQPGDANTCELYPIAFHVASLAGKGTGDTVKVLNGSEPGNFGWVTWTGDTTSEVLAKSLTPPGDSPTYTNPADLEDPALSIDDLVRARPGSTNAPEVRAALEELKKRDIIVPVWDSAAGTGDTATYRVDIFARLRLLEYELTGTPALSARFLGYAGCGSEPKAEPVSAATDEDTTVPLTLRASHRHPTPLVFQLGAPSHGALGASSEPVCSTASGLTTCTSSVTYTPEADYHGPDSFTYKVSDGRLESEPATVSLTVRPINDSPTFTEAPSNTSQTIEEGQGLAALLATDPDGDSLTYSLASGTLPVGITLGADGAFTGTAGDTSAGSYTAKITVSDGQGGSATTTLQVTVNGESTPLPPDPSKVASPIEGGVATDIAASTAFLYTGPNPIQTGVTPGAIKPAQAAVLRGKVTARDGKPISGVEVSVKDHPQLGSTLTRADGAFDLAVNGGGLLILNYSKDGYLPVQRQATPQWRDYEQLPDVVMIGLDPKVTQIDLSSPEPMQSAQGSMVTDEDGARRSTLLFPKGTSAEIMLPDGTKKALSTLHVRATEYTVGESGPEAMPGDLPATSGYTYAVELSVDEALAEGVKVAGKDVLFNQPVYQYVENFIGFPVGSPVPVGYYDADKGAWVPSDDGRVIKVLSITDGKAELDVLGTGTVADAAALSELGITDAERSKLAELYAPGTSLWRVAHTHLSTWDLNWPINFPTDATAPEQPKPEADKPLDEDCVRKGSIIGCMNQTLGEAVGVTGTGSSLHYASDRSHGYAASRRLEIPLGGASVPQSLVRIDLVVSVAGRSFYRQFPAAPNQRYAFSWDGKDAYGREVLGSQRVVVRVGYVYKRVYTGPARTGRSFAVVGFGVTVPSRAEGVIWQTWEGRIGSWNARSQGLGGWSLDAHHAYDPGDKMLLLGDGTRRSAGNLASVVSTAAGTGVHGASGDGGTATQAQVGWVRGLSAGPDGSIYLADTTNNRIRRITPDGTITTVAGNGGGRYTGDGIKATIATLDSPHGVEVAPDGSIYIADTANRRVRRVGPDGIITTVAGNGVYGAPLGEGGPATEAGLSQPWDVALGPDGSLYISDPALYRVLRVGPDGIIRTVAGTGVLGDPGEGGLATMASVGPYGIDVTADGSLYIADFRAGGIRRVGADGIIRRVAGGGRSLEDGVPAAQASLYQPYGLDVGSDGTIYIADTHHHRVRMVTPDGVIRTVAGVGTYGYSGDGGPATRAQLNQPYSVLAAPDGSVYFGDTLNTRIRRVTSALPGFGLSDLAIPSEDGSEVYRFDATGRHLTTLDALTGATLHSFAYDAQGRLQSVKDVDGRVTTVERDASGNPVSIISPSGQRTALEVNPDGFLSRITNPAGESVSLGYGTGGLLESFTDPKGNKSLFSYDASGRLLKDEGPGPEGSVTELARTDTPNGHKVVVSTALGRVTVHEIERLPSGERRITTTDPGGTKTVALTRTDGSQRVTHPDGTTMETIQGPSPRWGMLAPVTTSLTRRSPNGVQTVLTTSQTATLGDPKNPMSLTTQTETVAVNGKTYTTTYDAALRQITVKSPQGRRTAAKLDGKGRVVETQLAGTHPVGYTYDDLGRLTKVSQGDRGWTYAYDEHDRLVKVTDPLERTVSFAYDLAGRMTKQVRADGREITVGYDANGKLTSVTPPGRPAHAFGYTAVNLLGSYTAPTVGDGAATTEYGYDRDQALKLLTRPGGETVGFEYDGAGRIKAIALPGSESLGYAYDPANGNLKQVSGADGGTLSYGYDGSLLTGGTWAGAVSGSIGRTYNADLRVGSDTVNGGHGVSYGYDNDSLLTRAGDLSATRDPENGLLKGTALGGVTTAHAYDLFGGLEEYGAQYGATPLLSAKYSRDGLGRIKEKTETASGKTSVYAYTYDAAGRLTDVAKDGVKVAHYDYDENGNRTGYTDADGTTASGSYDDQDRLTRYGDASYAYTPAGGLKSKTVGGKTTSYVYDALGNLRSVMLPDGKRIEYVVDGHSRRIGKKADGALVQGFLYEDELRPLAELDGNNQVVSRFVYGTRINVPDYMIKGGVTYRIVSDYLGSPRLVVNEATGEIAQEMEYDEFGRALKDTNPGFQPFGFAGGLYDRDTGLVRFGARDYDAETGRWTAKDPVLFNGGQANLYAYVGNDPVNRFDPSGLAPEWPLSWTPSAYDTIGGALGAVAVAAEWGGHFPYGCSCWIVWRLVRPSGQACSEPRSRGMASVTCWIGVTPLCAARAWDPMPTTSTNICATSAWEMIFTTGYTRRTGDGRTIR